MKLVKNNLTLLKQNKTAPKARSKKRIITNDVTAAAIVAAAVVDCCYRHWKQQLPIFAVLFSLGNANLTNAIRGIPTTA